MEREKVSMRQRGKGGRRTDEGVLLSERDLSNSAGDLASDEGATTARGLVVEEDTVGSVHVVRLACEKKKRLSPVPSQR
jgi:hypothetical protein